MNVEAIERQIERAISDESQSGRLRRALVEHAKAHGREVGERELSGAVEFVVDYVRQVPVLMRDGLDTARLAGIEAEMRSVLGQASSYWEMPEDMIPDRLGLLGVLDDAYCSLSMIQSVSERHERETGRALFGPDLQSANEAMRRLIGEPVASQLDMYVGSMFDADPMLQMVRALTAVAQSGHGLDLPVDSGSWGGRPVDEIVRSRLGSVGLA